ncbi:MAG: PPC domain-containing protein [Clostridia bacterium]|nr:PPC domain-containing protein [Clostridia bacterium]
MKKPFKITGVCLVVFALVLSFSAVAFAGVIDELEPNNNINDAQILGTWSQYNSVMGVLPDTQDTDFYRFYAYQGDRLAVKLSSMEVGNNLDLYIYDSNFQLVGLSTRVSNADEIVRIDVPASDNYYIQVIPVAISGSTPEYYWLNFYNRIKTGSYTASLTPSSISSPGAGTVSPIASVNLTNNTSIPNGAIVKRVQAQGTISPSLGNTFRQVLNADQNIWHTTSSGGTIFTSITLNNQLPVKTTWNVRYYSLAYSRSTWSYPKLLIDYEYDQTLTW